MKQVAEIASDRVDELARRLVKHDGYDPDDARETAENTLAMLDDRWQRIAPRRFQAATVADLDGAAAEAVAEWRRDPTRNLVLLGAVGTGKTYVAAAVMRHCVQAGRSVAFWPVVELLDEMRPSGDGHAVARAAEVEFLVLDDLGSERPTDWTAERMYALVNRRWLERRPIIATSNLSAVDGKGPLVDAIGPRMYSRLVHGAVVVQLAGPDRRRAA